MNPIKPLFSETPVPRRSFIGTAAAASLGGGLLAEENAKKTSAETVVKSLYDSLSEQQREKIVIPWEDPLRQKIENNWHVLKERVGTFFNPDQQAMVREIFRKMHSEEYRDAVWQQFIGDNRERSHKTPEETFGTASVAIFGEPGTDKFELVLTGRHTTRRCDGNSLEGAAFGGPIFYGHAAQGFNEKPDHPGNAYWFQALRANELFAMLDGNQQTKALKGSSRGERGRKTVELKGHAEGIEGLRVGEMSADQKDGMQKVLDDLLALFRKEDREESMKYVNAQMDDLHIAFYKNEDVGNDGVWDTFQIEGPSMIWYFRGDPHVHTWVNIEKPKGDPFKAGEASA